MDGDVKPQPKTRIIGIRVDDEQKALIEQAAEREGLQVSSFLILVLVRLKILAGKQQG